MNLYFISKACKKTKPQALFYFGKRLKLLLEDQKVTTLVKTTQQH